MRESMRILKHLIINNSINDRDDAELFDLASREDIREELDVMSEEWDSPLSGHSMIFISFHCQIMKCSICVLGISEKVLQQMPKR